MKNRTRILLLAAGATLALSLCAHGATGVVVVTDFVSADGKTDVADALQKVIDTHPNRTLYFPDGTYLLSKPIATPAEPTLSVDLQLSNYAVLKAAPGWTNTEAMVRLGGIHPANNIRTLGSNYSFSGGIIDGSDVAKGISIDSGRETKVRCVSIKNVLVGLHIKHGANGNSSDSDIADVNIVGNGATNSVGVFIESCDNTLSNMRIAGVLVGVKLTGSGNLMQNLHPLYAYRPSLTPFYSSSVGFLDMGNNHYRCCYSDHFSTGFLLNGRSILESCIVWWYGKPEHGKGQRRTAIVCPRAFTSHVTDLTIGFKGALARNTVLEVAKDGGKGFLLNPMLDEGLVNETDKAYRKYVQGCVAREKERGGVVSAAGLAGDGTVPCSDAIQRLIDQNPNREIFFPDGTYLLDKPICTPAHPEKSVALRLSTYAKFKAAPGWTNTEAMVRLGGIHPANNIMLPGSWYWLKGGIIDGSGVAKGVSIDGGRETLVADVSMKGVLVGLHIKRGANSGSSDADIRNVNIVGNNATNSIGVLIDGYDNTLANMRIYSIVKGVVVNSGGNCLRDIHPLVAMKRDKGFYDSTIGFEINSGHNWMDFCYSDQFCTGFKFGPRGGGVLDKCFCFWYLSKPGMRHVGFSSVGKFNAKVQSPTVVFRNNGSTNCLVEVGAPDGKGYIKDADCQNVNDPRDASAQYRRE